MKSRLLLLSCLFIFIGGFSQDFSNKGTDFWIAYPAHIDGTNSRMAIYITSNVNSSGNVEVNGATIPFTVAANQIKTIQFTNSTNPSNTVVYNSQLEGIGIKKGIHITSDNPIVVYSHILNAARSGSTLVLPTKVLGKEYYVATYSSPTNSANNGRPEFAIVATSDNTTIEITPTANDVQSIRTAGVPFQINLQKGDVYQYQSDSDLTGTYIKSVGNASSSCQTFAVFSGSSRTFMGCNNPSSGDNLYQQLFPFASWGKNFVTVPFINRAYDIFRILVQDPSTIISVNGIPLNQNTLINGRFYEFNTIGKNIPQVISSDKPICVFQYMIAQNCDNVQSDPEMIILNSVEQTLNDITVMAARNDLTPPATNINSHYLNIIFKTDAFNSLKINGLTPKFNPIVIPGTSYSYIQENITTSTNSNPAHRIISDSGFICIAYGYGNVESYGYNAGTAIKDLNKIATFQNPFKRLDSAIACVNTPFEFSVPLSFIPSTITWDFTAAPNITPNNQVGPQPNPVYDSLSNSNGQNVYYYSNKNTYTFLSANSANKQDTIKVYTTSLTPDGCGSTEQTYLIPVKVSPLPAANFTYNGACITDSVRFFDATNTLSESFIEKAIWTFDDGTSDSVINPVKKFSVPKTYNVRYQPISSYGCIGDTTIPVTLSTPPQAAFTNSLNTCSGNAVTFTDSSTIISGNIVKWIWNFGEGASVTNTSNAPVTHTYAAVGKYNATLQVETSTGCKSTVFNKEITVYANPVADFSFPAVVCLPSGLTQFTNLSTISDGSTLQYNWNFGDNQTSTLKDPLHKYNSAGPFNATLTVTSNQGCSRNITKSVNTILPQPKANFNVSAETCLGDTTLFTDVSDGLGSAVTQRRWNFGDGNTSDLKNPKHVYNTAGLKTITLSVITDKGCVSDTMTKTAVVNPLPVADFTTSSPACETKTITITNQSVANAGTIIKWNWDFADGTTPVSYTSGVPFPKTFSAAGTYNIILSVETDKGCKKSITKPVVINPQPIPNIILPEVCLNDAFAQFVDSSYIAGNSNLTFLWNFGDNNASPSNPNTSTLKNPIHKYAAVGIYKVTMTVTSAEGCSSTIVEDFTVNGSIPVANFNVLNSSGLCSNSKVEIQNVSTVDFGSITKVEIIWDLLSEPAVVFTDNNPSPNKIYSHNYPALSTAKNYEIKFRAYSGGTCVNETSKTISVSGSPKVNFTAIPDVCFDVNPYKLTQASETTGIAGSFTYNGKGVTSAGIFSPSSAGVGASTIKYTYTTSAGCKDSATQNVTVLANPKVNAGPDLFILEGGTATINASATGNNLSYLWTPATYLDNATILTPRITPTADVTYKLTVTATGGCTSSDQVFVKVLLAPEVPGAFSPNKDGINDTWNIQFLETYPGAIIEVFNRYGNLVFTSTGYNKQWDGTYKGTPLPVGVYYYIINPKNGRKQITGSVTILR